MPIAIIATVVALFGITAREAQVNHQQQQIANDAQTRVAAAADPACQEQLRYAPNDSVRASIVDGCVYRLRTIKHVAAR